MKTGKYAEFQKQIKKILKNKINIEFIHGCLTAILCAPEIVPPSVWLPPLLEINGKEPEFNSEEEANDFIGSLTELYNEIAESVMDGSFTPLYSVKQQKINPDIAKTWCIGFINGTGFWDESFIHDETARQYLSPIMFTGSKEAESWIRENVREKFGIENLAFK